MSRFVTLSGQLLIHPYETYADEVAPRLGQMGQDVTMYCRSIEHEQAERSSDYNGIRLVHLPSIRTKFFDLVSHTVLATFQVLLKRKVDVAYYCDSSHRLHSDLTRRDSG